MSRILVVDDEEHIRSFFESELADEGHEVITVATGLRLVERIESIQPEVVILDIKLVDSDGLDLLQEIREFYPDLSVILCSAYDSFRFEPKAMAADYYVIKSCDLSELKTKVEWALEANSVTRQPDTEGIRSTDRPSMDT
ncbi:response regulator [Desulforhabdus amnigena]|uniref:Two-component system response regulator n=1 Tax=Desulforhabdus amnigena TaxID=40218 RepID=A0A9W6D6L1_9BACT|nr:response regulator [Desulforhabdus amnigena]NLJ26446.1 response regulator [Deltaproteobacteria bacterium]GLI34661.1 two-component system response regulator [Desulforhabdus amnigena]